MTCPQCTPKGSVANHADMTTVTIDGVLYRKCGSCGYHIAEPVDHKKELQERLERAERADLIKQINSLREEVAEYRGKWESERKESARLRRAISPRRLAEFVREESAHAALPVINEQPIVEPPDKAETPIPAVAMPTEIEAAHESKPLDKE